MKRRNTTIVCSSIILFGAAVILTLDLISTEERSYKQISAWTAVFLCKGPASVMYTYINNYMAEVFPTEIRGSGAGLVTAVARYIGAISALVKTMISGSKIELIVPCSVLSLFVIPATIFMPETINKQIELVCA